METQDAIDLARQAILTGLLVAAPVLLTGLATGLAIGLLQALTQVQEQTVSFVPKILMMALAMSLTLPWAVVRMVEYSRDLISSIPDNL